MKNWLAILSILICATLSLSAGLISGKGYFPEPRPDEGVIPEEIDDEAIEDIMLDQDEELDEDIDNPDER